MYRPRDGSSSFALNRQYWSFLPAAHYINIPFMLYITIGFGGIASFYLSPQNNDLIKKSIKRSFKKVTAVIQLLIVSCSIAGKDTTSDLLIPRGRSILHQQINSCVLKLLMKCWNKPTKIMNAKTEKIKQNTQGKENLLLWQKKSGFWMETWYRGSDNIQMLLLMELCAK